ELSSVSTGRGEKSRARREAVDHAKRAIRYYHADAATRYRAGDERETPTYRHYCPLVRDLSTSFGRRINALEIGCGTGRYFHCLREVDWLVGIDVSPHMIEQCRHPVHAERLDIGRVQLECTDVFSLQVPT